MKAPDRDELWNQAVPASCSSSSPPATQEGSGVSCLMILYDEHMLLLVLK